MLTLKLKGNTLFTTIDGEEKEVRALYARPISAPNSDISIVLKKSKKEIASFDSLEAVPADLRPLIAETLAAAYPLTTITAITAAQVTNGQRLITVETNRGSRQFNLKEPGKNITPTGNDGLLIRDSMGNRYLLPSTSALDPTSSQLLDQVT